VAGGVYKTDKPVTKDAIKPKTGFARKTEKNKNKPEAEGVRSCFGLNQSLWRSKIGKKTQKLSQVAHFHFHLLCTQQGRFGLSCVRRAALVV
jgi:hypothetical protein